MPLTNTASDAGKRVAETYALHRLADPYESIGKFFAVKLEDGRTDNVLYDTRADAVRHTDESHYAYVQIGPWPMSPEDATMFLEIHRRAYKAGMRLQDPDSVANSRVLIPRLRKNDVYKQLAALFSGN